jgi:hypothetical protein
MRSFDDILVALPEPTRGARLTARPSPTRIDFLKLDAENRKLGNRGEEFVFELEKRRLQVLALEWVVDLCARG